ncbi:MAG: cyclic-di-AMP receptor [Anaerolineales bacterium]|jgi:uncharacterized protein YaaQ|nr:cyclic-di-AMP receptor [Anaerolineales bacterium]
MKMIIAILRDEDVDAIVHGLTAEDFRVTRVASTGGFFRRGSTTLLLGVEKERVDAGIEIIRTQLPPNLTQEKRATVFVVPIDRFERI